MFYIKQKNWDTILGYAEEAHTEHQSEIGGMSVMVEDKDGDWHLENPVILKQVISVGNTILDKDELAIYYTKEAKRLGKKNFRFCWWHSHHTMNAFWSGTDLTAIKEYDQGDFSFALVVNLKEEYKFRVSVWKPVEVHEDVELEIINGKNKCTKKMKEEVAELCSQPTRTYTNSWSWKKTGSNYGGYQSNDQLLKEAAEDPRQEALPLHTTAGSMISSGKPTLNLSSILEEVDDVNGDLCDGTITYSTYKDHIDGLNKELIDGNSIYKVVLLREEQKDDLLHILPNQLVVYRATGQPVNDLYSYNYMGGIY